MNGEALSMLFSDERATNVPAFLPNIPHDLLLIIVAVLSLCVLFLFIFTLFVVRRNNKLKLALRNMNLVQRSSGVNAFICAPDGTILFQFKNKNASNGGETAAYDNLHQLNLSELRRTLSAFEESFARPSGTFTRIDCGHCEVKIIRLDDALFKRPCALWISTDTAYKGANLVRLQDEKNIFRAAIMHTGEPIFLCDNTGLVQMANNAVGNWLDLNINLFTGQRFCDMIQTALSDSGAPMLSPELLLPSDSPTEGRVYENLTVVVMGKRKHANMTLFPAIGSAGNHIGVIIIFHDIETEQANHLRMTRMHRELESLSRECVCAAFHTDPETGEIMFNSSIGRLWPFEGEHAITSDRFVYKDDLNAYTREVSDFKNGIRALDVSFRSDYYGTMRHYRMRSMDAMTLANNRTSTLILMHDITREVHERLESTRTQLYLDRILEIMPLPLFIKDVNNGYRYTLCNTRWTDALNLSRENILDHDDFELFTDRDFAQHLRDVDVECNASDTPQVNTHVFLNKNGTERTMQVFKTAFNTPDGGRMLLNVALDITDEINTQRQVTEEREFLHQILDNLPICVSVKDASDHFRYRLWNRQLEQHSGVVSKEVLGKTDFELNVYPGSEERRRQLDIQTLDCGTPVTTEEHYVAANGHPFIYKTVKTVIRAQNRLLILGAALDITADKALEEQRENHIRDLNVYNAGEKILNDCRKRVSLSENAETAARDILKSLTEAVHADRASLLGCDIQQKLLSRRYLFRNDADIEHDKEEITLTFDDIIMPLETLLANNTFTLNNTSEPPENMDKLSAKFLQHGVHAVLMAAVFKGEQLNGVVVLEFSTAQRFSTYMCSLASDAASLISTARERIEQMQLIAEHVRMQRTLLDALPLPIMLLNTDYTIAHMNMPMARMSGGTPEHFFGRHCYGLVCTKTCPDENCAVHRVKEQNGLSTREIDHCGRHFLLYDLPIFAGNTLTQVLEYFVDMTDEYEKRRLLESAAADAKEMERAKSLLLSGVSHELRSPLNAIIGFCELLKKGQGNAREKTEAVDAIYTSGKILLERINDVLSLSKLEADEMPIEPRFTDLRALVDELRVMYETQLKQSGIDFICTLDDDLPSLFLDPTRVHQILINLVSNAAKFTQQGYIMITAHFTPDEAAQTGCLVMSVEDTGIGMSDEFQKKLFTAYKQERTAQTEHIVGTGIGLNICKRLTEKMGGSISAKSELHHGAQFRIEIPNVRFSYSTNKVREPAAETVSVSYAGRRVMIVDDTYLNTVLLERLLKNFDLTCRLCPSAATALRIYPKFKPDLIITDMWMPEMNGDAFAAELTRLYGEKRAYTALLSADTVPAETAAQFNEVMLKPVTQSKLTELLRKAMTRTATAEEGGQDA